MVNFINLVYLEAVGVKKIVWLFIFFSNYLALCGGSWYILSDWCLGLLNVVKL